jgi:drug/metabolite transporter (DMT)-like permease
VVIAALAVVAPGEPTENQLLWGAAAGVCVGVGTIGLYHGLSAGSMSLIAPISSVGVLIPVIAGFLGGDRPSQIALGGMVLVMLGLIVSGGAEGPAGREGFAWAALGALGFGFFFVALDQASVDGPLWATAASWTASTLFLAAIVLITRTGNPPRPGRGLSLAVASGLLAAVATLGFAFATERGLLSLVAVLSSLYPAVTLALAQLLLGERLGRVQWAGVLTVLAGVAAIIGGA